jgi:hypothetical protein
MTLHPAMVAFAGDLGAFAGASRGVGDGAAFGLLLSAANAAPPQ